MEYNALQFGHTRSGSTVVWQIVNYIFGKAKKTHDFIKTDKPVIVTYRDFRASTISRWRIDNPGREKISKPEIIRYAGVLIDKTDILNQYRDYYGNRALYLRYENVYLKNGLIIDLICDKFSVYISEDFKKDIIEKTSINSNKKVSDKLKVFKFYDKSNHIHGSHIYSTGLDSWKDFVLPKDMELLNSILLKRLKEWNY